jgi:hypothetical protein
VKKTPKRIPVDVLSVAVSAFLGGNGSKNNVDAFRNEECGKEEEW